MNSSFVPLKTYQGFLPQELKILIRKRDVFIWGTGYLGLVLNRHLKKNKLFVKAFCDSDSNLQGSYIDQKIVVSPKEVLSLAKKNKAFIIIASNQGRIEIERICTKIGLKKQDDFLSYINISRQEAIIDISGEYRLQYKQYLNSRKLSSKKYINLSVYSRILSKLLLEMPFLININLSFFGEPLMNPEIAEIIKLTEKFVPCTMFTDLQTSNRLDDIIKSQPSQIIITVAGYGKTNETYFPSISWKRLYKNLCLLRKIINKYRSKSQINILYLIFKNNQNQDLNKMRSLCLRLGFRFNTSWAYLDPYDKILASCQKKKFDERVEKNISILPWDFKKTLTLAQAESYKPCLCQRIFPIVNYDLSVAVCHLYHHPIVVKNFLSTPLKEIIKLRHKHQQCILCQKYGLHRLDVDVLLQKYPKNKIIF